jgi:DNA-binding beta-propeller fold protein YncE
MDDRKGFLNWFCTPCAFAAVLLAALQLNAGEPPLEKVQTIELRGVAGPLDHLMVDHKHSRLLVANQSNNTLDVVDLKTGKLMKQVADQKEIHGIAYSPELDRVFVGNGEGTCNILDGRDYTVLKSQRVADADNVRLDPRTHRVYVAGEKEIAIIDGKSLDQVGAIKLSGSPEGFQLDSSNPRLFVNTNPPNQVAVVDTGKNEAINHFALPGEKGVETLVLDENGGRIFVGLRGDPMVVMLDRESGKEIARVRIPNGIDDMFFDSKAKCIYASCSSGCIAVIRQGDADHYELLAKIPTTKGAKTCFFDPETDRLYLAVPRQKDKKGPEIWVYQVRQ